ncbi:MULTISPECIES: hypothetical protein [Chitinophagaceae]
MKKVTKRAIVPGVLFMLAFTHIAYGQNTFPATGNVGVGTTTPVDKLTVVGNNQSISVSSGSFDFSTSTPIGARFGTWHNDPVLGASGIKFYRWTGGGTSFHVAYIGQAKASVSNTDYGIDFRTDAVSSLVDASTSRMFISSKTGNVGIGTTSPVYKLTVSGEGRFEQGISVAGPAESFVNNGPWYGLAMSSLNLGQTGNAVQLAGYYGLNFQTASGQMVIHRDGNVGIGTLNPTAKLSVNGAVKAREVIVTVNGSDWPDYIFRKDYKLPSLDSLSVQIAALNHLPGMPSAQEVKNNGIELGDMNRKLLEKIEELTLYILRQERRIKVLEQKIEKKQL